MQKPQILCIVDDPYTGESIVETLDDEGFRVLLADTARNGICALSKRPDLVLCDIDLPDVSGLEVLRRIRQERLLPKTVPFIVVVDSNQRRAQLQAHQLGCDGIVAKPVDLELLVAIVRNRLSSSAPTGHDPSAIHLTDRELETLTWVARGKSSAGIAVILGVSERTVNFHMDNVIRKTGVATRVQAAIKCAMLGLIEP